MRYLLPIVLIVLLGVVLWVSRSATTASSRENLFVCLQGCPLASIQAAIDAAQPGDTVVVRAGIYRENVIIAKPLTLRAEAPMTVILESLSTQSPALTIRQVSPVVVQNLTIRGGSVGIQSEGGTTLTGNRIAGSATGLKLFAFGPPIVVEGNQIFPTRIGLLLLGNGPITLRGNEITGPGAPGAGQGIGLLIGGLVQATLEGNWIQNWTDGALLGGSGQLVLRINEISETSESGLVLADHAMIELVENRIVDNGGWGIALQTRDCLPAQPPVGFAGMIQGNNNLIPDPGQPHANANGALCPAYPGSPWPAGFKR